MGDREAGGGAGEPGRSLRQGRGRGPAAWLAWIRAEPALALAVIGFCVVAIGALALSLPRGTLSKSRASRGAGGASVDAPPSPASVAPRDAPLSRAPVSRAPDSAADGASGPEPGPSPASGASHVRAACRDRTPRRGPPHQWHRPRP